MDESSQPAALAERRVLLLGQLGGLTRREAQQLIRRHGGQVVDASQRADLVVIGADELPIGDVDPLLDEALRREAAAGRVEIIDESELLSRVGQLDSAELIARRLYTPAMLADLLDVSVATIRRWWRRGLIIPVKEVRRLAYFDFQEVATARRVAQLLAAGTSPRVIERQLVELARFVPRAQRPLAQLHVIVEGKRVLLRQGEGLVEPGGQRWIDFEALEESTAGAAAATVSLPPLAEAQHALSPQALLQYAEDLEDEGQLDLAAEAYRTVLAASGPRADICFQLAELLYRLGDVTAARERYYMAIELDEDFVEARANLGCVLAETGQLDLAIAAFRGTLAFHPEYPDVHYHLARALDELEQADEARSHWQQFLQLAPDSPWAEEARARLA
jgi:tetratricopeptide (TPR) repeat protein